MSTNPTLEEILSRLNGVTQCGNYFKALCPCHPDRNPSLTVKPKGDGGALLYCQVCKDSAKWTDFLKALGLNGPDTARRCPGRKHR